MPKVTQLYDYHEKHAKLTEFAGYEMPLWYTTTTDEHLAVRNSSGIFDVSHMGRFVVKGAGATESLESLVPTAVATQPEGKAFYTLLLNEKAGIIDDLIIMRLPDSEFLAVVNAANAETDLAHMREVAGQGVEITDVTDSTAMIAVQGPNAATSLQRLTETDLSSLKRFRFAKTTVMGHPSLISRTGYTGEDGFEVIVERTTSENNESAMEVWEALAKLSTPCGLGARDSLRLEAGYPLHGSDIDQQTDPFTADLGWVISAGKGDYVGSTEIDRLRSSKRESIRRGLVLEKGIPRHGFEVLDKTGNAAGKVTSGTFSPLLKRGIALCMVRSDDLGPEVKVSIRGSAEDGKLAKPPFYDETVYGWKRLPQR